MEQPELYTYSWFEDGMLGNPTINCGCGMQLTEASVEFSMREECYRCPKCGKKIVVKWKVWLEYD